MFNSCTTCTHRVVAWTQYYYMMLRLKSTGSMLMYLFQPIVKYWTEKFPFQPVRVRVCVCVCVCACVCVCVCVCMDGCNIT